MDSFKDKIYPLVKHAVHTGVEDIPDCVLEKAAVLFQDTVGCILSGSSADGIKELKGVLDFWGGSKQSSVFSFCTKTNVPYASFLNSAMGHANDYDDTHDEAVNHGCVTIVPALIAVAEVLSTTGTPACKQRKISGEEFIAALAVGLDISNRLGMAFIPYLHTGWLPTTLWGPFASAAACGRLLRLDEMQMHNAFGLAYSQVHGNRQALVDGALAKRLQPAFSAMAGVQASFLAACGITAGQNIINGDFGISELYTSGNINPEYLTNNIGVRYETMNVSIKPYPCCRCTHPVIDAAINLKKQNKINWDEISEGTIYIPPTSMGQIGNEFAIRDNPTVDAQFSAQYTAALVFFKGRPELSDFNGSNVASLKEIAELASRFRVIEFEKNRSGIVPVELYVKTKAGKTLETRIEFPKGSSKNPLTEEEMEFKFYDCISHSVKNYTEEQQESILFKLNDVLKADSIMEIIDIL